MEYIELITLYNFAEDMRNYSSLLDDNGFEYEDNGLTIILRLPYEPPGRFDAIKKMFEKNSLILKSRRSIYTEYNDEDRKNAQFLLLLYPEIFTNEIEFTRKCPACGKRVREIDYSVKIKRVKSRKPILSVNGEVVVVNSEIKEKLIHSNMKNLRFYPFDINGNYFYLTSDVNLGEHIFRETETINLREKCSKCDEVQFDMYYGPFRYSKTNWNGEDFVNSNYPFPYTLCSYKAYNFLKSIDKKIKIGRYVFLE